MTTQIPPAPPYNPNSNYPLYQGYPPMPYYRNFLPKGFAIASMIMGIMCLSGAIIPFVGIFTGIFGILAVIFGIIALVKIANGTGSGKGMSITGIITGATGIIISILLVIFIVSILEEDFDYYDDYGNYNYAYDYDDDYDDFYGWYDDYSNHNYENTHKNTGQEKKELNTDWTQGQFILGEKEYTLGKTTIQELLDDEWIISEDKTYTYIAETLSTQQEMYIPLTRDSYYVSSYLMAVIAPSDSETDIKDSLVKEVTYSGDGYWENEMEIEGVKLGDTYSKVKQILGEPTDKTEEAGIGTQIYYYNDDKTVCVVILLESNEVTSIGISYDADGIESELENA